MTYVVDDKCIKCKLMDCVEVCPDECIDRGVCEPECPIDAIHSDAEENMEKWAEINRIYAEKWPMINEKKEPHSDSKDWENVNNKFEKYFSKKPGQ